MVTCKVCETESPSEAETLLDWLLEEEQHRWIDEFVFGTSFMCPACGARLDPTEMVVFLE